MRSPSPLCTHACYLSCEENISRSKRVVQAPELTQSLTSGPRLGCGAVTNEQQLPGCVLCCGYMPLGGMYLQMCCMVTRAGTPLNKQAPSLLSLSYMILWCCWIGFGSVRESCLLPLSPSRFVLGSFVSLSAPVHPGDGFGVASVDVTVGLWVLSWMQLLGSRLQRGSPNKLKVLRGE